MFIVLTTLALWGGAASAAPEPVIPTERRTLVEPDADEVWVRSGFRADIGYAFVPLWGLNGGGDFLLHTPAARFGFALDEHWSLGARAAYGAGGAVVRWTVTVEPMWQPIAGLRVGLGVGYAGMLRNATELGPLSDALFTEDSSDPLPATQSCNGQGVVFAGGVEYTWVLHQLFATGPSLRGEVQWTACDSPSSRLNAETGTYGSTRYNWTHAGVALGWWLSWR